VLRSISATPPRCAPIITRAAPGRKKAKRPLFKPRAPVTALGLISAISSRGHMRFVIKQEGGVNAAVFVEILKRLIASRAIVLIVDRGPAHIVWRKPERIAAAVLSPSLVTRSQS
jgi:hypothetical protein